ncbi:hypothetical protein ACNVED_16515 (plasmid) [Legionella sp. D16C41]|uniref:hypothetical protein n=1 Tax=Legionella sp. D16C41 TaxID=3402688 RepID=UPI003AF6F4D5
MFFSKVKIITQLEFEIGTCSRMGSGTPHSIEHKNYDSLKKEIISVHNKFCSLINQCYNETKEDYIKMGEDAYEYNGVRVLYTIKGILNEISLDEKIESIEGFFNFAEKYFQILRDKDVDMLLECGKYNDEKFLLFCPNDEARVELNYCSII